MRIHTCGAITEDDIRHAAARAAVTFETLTQHGSRKQHTAYNVKLLGSSPYRPNSGHRGADGDAHAATWDEWGIFLAWLYSLDPFMATPYDQSADHFHWRTDRRFVYLHRVEQHRRHKWEPNMYPRACYSEQFCECGARNRWLRPGVKFEDVRAQVGAA
jgi:hypothetical protein